MCRLNQPVGHTVGNHVVANRHEAASVDAATHASRKFDRGSVLLKLVVADENQLHIGEVATVARVVDSQDVVFKAAGRNLQACATAHQNPGGVPQESRLDDMH